MTDIQPGDWVKHIRAPLRLAPQAPALRVGAVFRVLRVLPHRDRRSGTLSGKFGLILEGYQWIGPDGTEGGFTASRFRKLNRLSDQFREKLLEPVDIGADA